MPRSLSATMVLAVTMALAHSAFAGAEDPPSSEQGAVETPAAKEEPTLPSAELFHVRLEYLFWSPSLSGQVQKGLSDSAGSVLDAKLDLAIDTAPTSVLHGNVRFGGRWKMRGGWERLDGDGDVTPRGRFTYGGISYEPPPKGDTSTWRLLSSMTANHVTAAIEYEVVQRRLAFAAIRIGLEYFDVSTTLVLLKNDQSIGARGRVADTERLPIPVAGVAVRVYPIRQLSLEGDFSGLPAGDWGTYWDLQLAARGHLIDQIAVTAGWRRLSLWGANDRDSLEIGLSKWTLGLEISL